MILRNLPKGMTELQDVISFDNDASQKQTCLVNKNNTNFQYT